MKASVVVSALLLACVGLVAAAGNGGLYRMYSSSDCASANQIGFAWIDPAGDSVGNRTINCTLADSSYSIYYTYDNSSTLDPNFNSMGFPYFGHLSSTNTADCNRLNLYGGQLSTCVAAPLANNGWATFLISKCDNTGVSFDFGLSVACAYNYNYQFTSAQCAVSDSLLGQNFCATPPTAAPTTAAPVASPVAQNTPTGTPIVSNPPIDSNPPTVPIASNPPSDSPTGSNIPTAPTAPVASTTPTATPKGKVAAGSSVVAGIFSLAAGFVLLL